MEEKPQTSKRTHVAVLGGGAGGVATALKLALSGDYTVSLFEKNSSILRGSSDATPGRAGHGFHYIHSETGIRYINSTIEVRKKYPDCFRGYEKPSSHHMRHGFYFILKEPKKNQPKDLATIFPVREILKAYQDYKLHYKKRVSEDKSTEVFGPPDNFYVISDKKRFQDIVQLDLVDTVVDTREELLDWPKLREQLDSEITKNTHIKVYTNSFVNNVTYSKDGKVFEITANNKIYIADMIVNATWENIEVINRKMLFAFLPQSRTIRLKTIVTVQLPTVLVNQPSMFFCMGPHCMFSNMGDGTGMITYAPVTNRESAITLRLSHTARRLLYGGASEAEKKKIALAVIEGVSKYIPPMREAKVIKVGFGVIRTEGTVDIFDPASKVHERMAYGVCAQQVGWVDNACMKLMHFLHNADATHQLLNSHVKAQARIHEISNTFSCKTYRESANREIRKSISIYLQRYIDTNLNEQQHTHFTNTVVGIFTLKYKLPDDLALHFISKRLKNNGKSWGLGRFSIVFILLFIAMYLLYLKSALELFLSDKNKLADPFPENNCMYDEGCFLTQPFC